jgi:hypothetical protein
MSLNNQLLYLLVQMKKCKITCSPRSTNKRLSSSLTATKQNHFSCFNVLNPLSTLPRILHHFRKKKSVRTCTISRRILYKQYSINLPNPPRHNLNNMPLPIPHINTPPTQFPLHSPQNLHPLLLKMLLPLPQLLNPITRKRDMLS